MQSIKFILIIFVLNYFNKSNAFQVNSNTADTTYLKNLNYKKLDEFVSYYVIKGGNVSSSKNIVYSFKSIADYYYLNNSYILSENSKEINGKSGDIAKLIQSNKFSERTDFHGIFKINSKMEFKLRPDILKKMSVFPKQQDAKSAHRLMNKLKKEAFVSSLALDSMSQFSIIRRNNKAKKRIYIKLRLNSKYSNLKSLGAISDQLKKWPDIADAVYVQLFTGRNETDVFFDVTSKIEVIAKKEVVKKNQDPFKTFVDSLKNL
jgi:hypothetical protein